MPKRTILIVSELDEPNVNSLIHELVRLGSSWIRFNTETFPILTKCEIRIGEADPHGLLYFENSTLDTRSIGAVWNRRAPRWVLPASLSKRDTEFSEIECSAAIAGFLELVDAVWVNDRHSERRANNKVLQLSVARSVGLRIPRTIVTNCPESIDQWLTEKETRTIFKPVAGGTLPAAGISQSAFDAMRDQFPVPPQIREAVRDQVDLVFSQELTAERREHLSHIQYCPVVFQDMIPKALEIRTTIVGDDIFSASIDSQEYAETSMDFRRMVLLPKGRALKHLQHRLPDCVEDQLRKLMGKLGLVFGCVDLILTPQGEYVFLEVNPAGQWQWIEASCGLPITGALAALLHRIANSECSSWSPQ